MTTIVMLPATPPRAPSGDGPRDGVGRGTRDGGDDFARRLDAEVSRGRERGVPRPRGGATPSGGPSGQPERSGRSGVSGTAGAHGSADGTVTVAQVVRAAAEQLRALGTVDVADTAGGPDAGAVVVDLTARLAERAAQAEADVDRAVPAEDAPVDGEPAGTTVVGPSLPVAADDAVASVMAGTAAQSTAGDQAEDGASDAADATDPAGAGTDRRAAGPAATPTSTPADTSRPTGTSASPTAAVTATAGAGTPAGADQPTQQVPSAPSALPVQPAQPAATVSADGTHAVVVEGTATTTSTASTTGTVAAGGPAAPTPAQLAAQLGEQLGARLAGLRAAGTGEHVLTLRVDPESFGPVRVVAHITPDGVRVELLGATEAARDALRSALPDLRRDLAGAGLGSNLDLGNPGTSGSGDRGEGSRATARGTDRRPGAAGDEADPTAARLPATPTALGGIDLLV